MVFLVIATLPNFASNFNIINMEFSKNSGEEISLGLGVTYVKAFRANNPKGVKAFAVGATHLQAILDQEGCEGIRIYNGFNEEENSPNIVVVGVDCEGRDMVQGKLLDRGIKCPDMCDIMSPLFQD